MRNRTRQIGILILQAAVFMATCGILCAQGVRINGRVASDTNVPLGNVAITFRLPGADPAKSAQALTDPTGAFSLTVSQPGEYLVNAERTGFFSLKNHSVNIDEVDNDLRLVLNPIRELAESLDVTSSPSAVLLDDAKSSKQLSGKELVDIPQPSADNLRNAMRIIPGVVQDSRGGAHLNGGAENQVLYLLDGFNIGDPLTGVFDTRLSVESVQSMTVLSGPLPAEYGKGSAGVVAVDTKTGDDRFRYSATNFIPGITFQEGLRVGNWAPRFNLSGPIARGKAWFSDSFTGQYDQTVIRGLAPGQDSSRSLRYNNLVRGHVNLTPSNVLQMGFLAGVWNTRRAGLSALDPPETTSTRRSHQYFFDVKDQVYFGNGALAEIGFASNRTSLRQIPQGHNLYIITPDGRSGNFYVDGVQRSSRDQIIANVFLPAFTFFGPHQLKTGVDLDRVAYDQNMQRTGFEVFSATLAPIRQVLYGGSGVAQKSNFETTAYLQDSWRVRSNVLIEMGLRSDWDKLLGNWNTSPRVGVAWAPKGLENTKVTAGFAISYDATNLELFTRPHDQYEIITWFAPYGPVETPSRSQFLIADRHYASPYFSTWSAGVDHRFGSGTYLKVQGLRRRGSNGLAYVGAYSPVTVYDPTYLLKNLRNDSYDSAEITVRQTFHRDYEFLASYTRSAARSNSVIDISADTSAIVGNNLGRTPWDAPNRFLTWGYLPTFWKDWAVAYMMETRSGFPFSIQNDAGYVLGSPDSKRYPDFFELNLHIEKKFRFRNQLWAGRAGFSNITNHQNPNTVINNIDSDRFLQFYGGQSRALVFRLRWLGKS